MNTHTNHKIHQLPPYPALEMEFHDSKRAAWECKKYHSVKGLFHTTFSFIVKPGGKSTPQNTAKIMLESDP